MVDLMTKEEDSILDGRPVWVVKSPTCSADLTRMCGVLQHWLDMDRATNVLFCLFAILQNLL